MSTVVSQPSSLILCEPSTTYAQPTSERLIEVLVDIPFSGASPGEPQKLFTYQVPTDLTVEPGDILSVPFGNQQLGAIAIRFVSCAFLDPVWANLRSVWAFLGPSWDHIGFPWSHLGAILGHHRAILGPS